MRDRRQPLFWIAFQVSVITLLVGSVAFAEIEWKTSLEKSGPIPMVNQSPVQLLFLQPLPERANIIPEGQGLIRLNTSLTNTLVSKQSNNYETNMDMEVLRISLDVGYGILPWLEFGCSFPVSHFFSGVLDSLIYDIEDFGGNVRGIRDTEQRNSFVYEVKKDGATIVSGSEDAVGIGDIPLKLKAMLLKETEFCPALSARASVKLPTGRKSKGFGSGEFDWGLGLLLEKDIKKVSVYVNGDVTFPGEAFKGSGVSLQEFYTVLLGLEYRLTPRFSLVAQTYHMGRPFSHTGVEPLDRRIHDLLFGVSYRAQGDYLVQGGFMEDIIDSADAGADVTFFLNIGLRFQ